MGFSGTLTHSQGALGILQDTGQRVLRVVVLVFLSLNVWYRVWTLFDYHWFVGGVFVFWGVCALCVVLFPRFLKAFFLLFGASFFLFGFRGYDIQSQVFESIVVLAALTVFLINLRDGEGGKGLNPTLTGMLLCYISLSVLSLMLLPIGHMVKDISHYGLGTFALLVANAPPDSYLYPLAGVNRLILFSVLALVVAQRTHGRDGFKTIFVGIFLGALCAAFVGLLNYFGIVPLDWYRKHTTPGALQSLFLNRGWFAEFLLTVVPFVLIGFMSSIKGFWWKVLLLGSLVVCEIALILAGARAGWVSYPLILFICWAFVYFSKEGRFEHFRFGWKDVVKIAVSVPITIGLSVLLIFQVFMPLTTYLTEAPTKEKSDRESSVNKGDSTDLNEANNYLRSRASQVFKASKHGRPYTWREGFYVAREAPLYGVGYESFNWHANVLSSVPKSHFSQFYEAWEGKQIHDTPHNIFVQLCVSGGVVGLMLWLTILVYALSLLSFDVKKNKSLLNMPVMISILSFHIYGIFQTMQYIPMIWCIIFLNYGYAMSIDERVLPERIRRITGWVIRAMVVLVVIGGVVYFVGRGSQDLADKYGLKAYAKDQNWHQYHGFYEKEKGSEGFFRWSGKRARVRIEGGGQKAEVVAFDVACYTPGVEEEPVVVEVGLDGERIDEMRFNTKGTKKRWYYLGDRPAGVDHTFVFDVSRTWNPRRMGISSDVRDLGVAVSEPRNLKEFPGEGVGFYHWEPLDEGSAERIAQASEEKGRRDGGTEGRRDGETEVLRFRWTGKRASLPIERFRDSGIEGERDKETEGRRTVDRGWKTDGGIGVFLKCSHPDIGEKPVEVRVMVDGEVLREIELRDMGWKKVVLDEVELAGKMMMTFEVSRTWNPKRMGVSADDRDLGLAVAIP